TAEAIARALSPKKTSPSGLPRYRCAAWPYALPKPRSCQQSLLAQSAGRLVGFKATSTEAKLDCLVNKSQRDGICVPFIKLRFIFKKRSPARRKDGCRTSTKQRRATAARAAPTASPPSPEARSAKKVSPPGAAA